MEVVSKIVKIVDESPRVKRFSFDCTLDFVPGAWVSLWSDDFCENGRPVRRAYSIASLPGEPLELCISRAQYFSAFIHGAKVGDKFHVRGPFGNFKLKGDKPVFFIAAGTGIVPFVSMSKQALSEGKKVVILYSARSKGEILCEDYFDSLPVDLHITLTQEQCDGFEHGRIPLILDKFYKKGFDYYLCGFNDFIDSVGVELMRLGCPKESIFFEKWG